jgi:hypothetical protein
MLESRQSKLEGTGLFTDRPIPPFTIVGRFEGKLWKVASPEDDTHVLWLDNDTALEVENELRYVNHADEPNCEVVILEAVEVALLVSLSEIPADAEITMHYGDEWE